MKRKLWEFPDLWIIVLEHTEIEPLQFIETLGNTFRIFKSYILVPLLFLLKLSSFIYSFLCIKNYHVHFYISYLNCIFRIDKERTKMPFQDFIAAEISLESEDKVDCHARKKLFNWSLLTFVPHKMNIEKLRINSCNVFCFHRE